MLVGEHRLTADLGTAAAMALRAGMDSELPTTAGFGAPLVAAIADGRIDASLVDLAVERILRLKFRLGLFERPVRRGAVDRHARPARCRGARARRDARPRGRSCCSRTTACCRCPPIGGRIAVIGPIADSARDLMGDYAHLPHIETLAELRHQANPFGFPSSDVIQPERRGRGVADDPGRASASASGPTGSRTPRGTGLRDGTDAEIAEAVAARARVRRSRSSSPASGPG